MNIHILAKSEPFSLEDCQPIAASMDRQALEKAMEAEPCNRGQAYSIVEVPWCGAGAPGEFADIVTSLGALADETVSEPRYLAGFETAAAAYGVISKAQDAAECLPQETALKLLRQQTHEDILASAKEAGIECPVYAECAAVFISWSEHACLKVKTVPVLGATALRQAA